MSDSYAKKDASTEICHASLSRSWVVNSSSKRNRQCIKHRSTYYATIQCIIIIAI